MRIALALLIASSCGAPHHDEPQTAAVAAPANPQGHGGGRDRWKGGGVYLDGMPIGMLQHAELPPTLQPVWETHRHMLPFRAGEPVRWAETKVPRYRVTDYLRALGVDLDQITQVHFHGANHSAMVLTREQLLAHPDDVLFRFAGETGGKPIPVIRNVPVGTSFDDLTAIAIYQKRTPPALRADQTLELDGHRVTGIPYYGEPMRQGVRVYVDDRLAMVLKRNQITGPMHLGDMLAKSGVAASIRRVELIHDEDRAAGFPWHDLALAFSPSGSGTIEVDADPNPTTAIALYTR